jgi:hypothetical protein
MQQDRKAPPTDQLLGGFFRARLTFPSEYPLLPPKMRFETPIFHPNSERLPPARTTYIPYSHAHSLPKRRSLHLHPPPARGRQVGLRVGRRAVVTSPNSRNHPSFRHLDAFQPKRRVTSEPRRGEIVA